MKPRRLFQSDLTVRIKRKIEMESAKLFFRENPFPATPSPERYVAVGTTETARVRLLESIDRREGPALLVGPAGTGKTLLCQILAANYRAKFDVAFLSETRICTRKALLQHLLHHLGLPYSDRSEGELRLALIDRAASGGPDSRQGVLIIVDEAHTLPSRLLEELRMMSGIVRNGSPRVQLVLAGGPSLDERLSQPRMEALSQRIGARCYLHPLGQRETGDFIRESFRRVGSDPSTCLDDSAIQSVYYASSGIIRLINQTMSRAVAIAESIGRSKITSELIERAWADLQQLPSPLCADEHIDSSFSAPSSSIREIRTQESSVIEFGELGQDSISSSWSLPSKQSATTQTVAAQTVAAQNGARRLSDPMAETTDYEPTSENPYNTNTPFNADSDDEVDEEVDEELEEEVYANADLGSLFGDDFDDEQVISYGVPSACQTETRYPLQEDIESALHDEIISINCEALSGSLNTFQQIATAHFEEPDLDRLDNIGHDLANDTPLQDEFEQDATNRFVGELNEFVDEEVELDSSEVWVTDEQDELLTLNDHDMPCLPFSVASNSDLCDDDEPVTIEERPQWSSIADDDQIQMMSDITVRDDSDMLIIEEDLEIDPVPNALAQRSPRDLDLADDDTDFQEIFAKLREG